MQVDRKSLLDYRNSFFFGMRFFVLISLLFIPPIVGFIVGVGINKALLNMPALGQKSMRFVSVQNYLDDEIQEETKNKSVFGIKGVEKDFYFYFKTDRPARNEDEAERARYVMGSLATEGSVSDWIDEIINKQEERKVFEQAKKEISDYDGRILYEKFNAVGNIIFVIFVILIILFVLSSYFPLIKAFINLFKFKRIF